MKTLIKILYLPFILPTAYLIKFPVKTWGSLNLLDLILIVGLLIGFIFIFKNNFWINFKKFVLNQGNLLWLFLFFATLATLSNIHWLKNLSTLKSFFILPITWSLMTIYLINKKALKQKTFFHCYYFYSLTLGILTIIYKFLEKTTFDNRVSLFFESPNQLAISVALGIITAWLLGSKNKLLLVALVVLIPALFLTKSAGAIAATATLVLVVLFRKRFVFLKTALIFSLIFTIFLVLSPLFIPQKSLQSFFENRNSLDSRAVVYLVTSKVISNNFLDGIGPKNFQETYLSYQKNYPPFPQWAIPHAHNFFLQLIVSFGFPCFVFFFFLLKQKIFSLQEKDFYVSLFLFYFLIHGLVDTPIWNNDQALFFWFIFLF